MTSAATDGATREFFATRAYFGLQADQVVFFPQVNALSMDTRSGGICGPKRPSRAHARISPDTEAWLAAVSIGCGIALHQAEQVSSDCACQFAQRHAEAVLPHQGARARPGCSLVFLQTEIYALVNLKVPARCASCHA